MNIDDILVKHGSDKATWHRYGPVYDMLFPDREKVTAVMEIGVADGCSIRAWLEAFPLAIIVGLDQNPEIQIDKRAIIQQGNQRDRNAVLSCARNRQFDLIIDDASHILHDQLACLFWLWPFLKPGGVYVVEEMDIQDGVGPAGNLASYGLLNGCKAYPTPSPNGEELLIVVEKPK